jgi:hypothetical protein
MTAPWRQVPSSIRTWAVCHPYSLLALLVLPVLGVYLGKRSDSEWESVYLLAAQHLRQGEYIYHAQDGYLYPPFTAWAAQPFTAMSPLGQRVTWVVINLIAVVAILRWAWRLAGGSSLEGQRRVPPHEHAAAVLGTLCGLPYLHNCLVHQQTDVLLAALLLGGCVLLAQARSLAAAACFGLAAAVKCTALLWVPYLVWRRQFGAAAILLGVAVGVNLLPDLVSRPSSGRTWLTEYAVQFLHPLTQATTYPGTWGSDILYNQSLAGAGQRWLARTWEFGTEGWTSRMREEPPHPAVVRAAVYAVQAGLLLLVFLVCRRPFQRLDDMSDGRARLVLECSLVLLLMLLLSPMSSKAHFGVLVLPGLCLARRIVATSCRWLGAIFFGALILGLISNKDPIGDQLYSLTLWYGFTTWQTLLLLLGCLLVLRPGSSALHLPWSAHAEPSSRAA